MSIRIKYSQNKIGNLSSNLVLFSNEKFSIDNLKKYFSNSEYSYVTDLLKNSDLKKNLFIFELTSKKKK